MIPAATWAYVANKRFGRGALCQARKYKGQAWQLPYWVMWALTFCFTALLGMTGATCAFAATVTDGGATGPSEGYGVMTTQDDLACYLEVAVGTAGSSATSEYVAVKEASSLLATLALEGDGSFTPATLSFKNTTTASDVYSGTLSVSCTFGDEVGAGSSQAGKLTCVGFTQERLNPRGTASTGDVATLTLTQSALDAAAAAGDTAAMAASMDALEQAAGSTFPTVEGVQLASFTCEYVYTFDGWPSNMTADFVNAQGTVVSTFAAGDTIYARLYKVPVGANVEVAWYAPATNGGVSLEGLEGTFEQVGSGFSYTVPSSGAIPQSLVVAVRDKGSGEGALGAIPEYGALVYVSAARSSYTQATLGGGRTCIAAGTSPEVATVTPLTFDGEQAVAIVTEDGVLHFASMLTSDVPAKGDIYENSQVRAVDTSIEVLDGFNPGRWGLATTSVEVDGTVNFPATSFSSYFAGFSEVGTIDLTGLDISSVTTFEGAFKGLSNLEVLTLPTTSVAVTSTASMFEGCSSLYRLVLKNATFTFAGTANLSRMFYGCEALTSLDLSTFDLSACTTATLERAFEGCTWLSTIVVSSTFALASSAPQTLDAANAGVSVFAGCDVLTGYNGSTIASVVAAGATQEQAESGLYARVDDATSTLGGRATPGYFTHRSQLVTMVIGLEDDDGYPLRDGSPVAIYTASTNTLRFYVYDGTKVNVDSSGMRYDGYAIDAVDTSPGTLDALVEVLPSVKTIQVVDKLALPTCDLSYYFAGTMRNGEAQFTAVKTFNLTSLDTSRVTSMEGMFANLTTLTYLDLTGFDTSAVCWAQNMFACTSSYESALQFIRVSDTTWAMPAEVEGVSSTYHMFYGCSCLYGAENTTIAKVRSTLGVSEDVATSGTYAVIDKGISSSSPGYLQSSSSGESTSSGGGSVVVGPIVVGGL